MANNGKFDNVNSISQAATKIVAIFALIVIIYIDANSPQDFKDIELVLSGFVAGAEALSAYKKINRRK